jgi:hypothetical protein
MQTIPAVALPGGDTVDIGPSDPIFGQEWRLRR